jgi:hypothetical protein
MVDSVDRAARLDDHRQEIPLSAGDERRQSAERLPEPEEHVGGAEADCDEEDRQPVVGDVAGRRRKDGHARDPTRLLPG